LGFPTGWLFTTHKDEAPTSTRSISCFSGAVAEEEVEDFCEGSFRTHILYFVLLFCFTLFILPALFYIKKPKKKLESLVVVISLLLVYHVDP
jgi:hypothetical protein